ncbi:MAG: trigger factor [Chloroflexia bacterium]
MQYKIERLPESRVAIDVELDPAVVEKALERASRRLSQKHPIRGFRPGKAPRRIVEAVYGRDALYEEATDELVEQAYREILSQGQIEPISVATLENVSFEPFSFRLVVPVKPTVTLCDYRALRFPLEPKPVTEEDVDARIEELRRAQLVWKEPEPPRPARSGDRCLVDMEVRYEDGLEEFAHDFDLLLEGESILPGLVEGLIGAQVGEVRELDLRFPDDLVDEDRAGQKVHLTVTVRAIREPELPALDDEWARSLGMGETVAELRDRVRRDLEEEALREAREKVIKQMLEAIQERSTVDLPQVLVDREAVQLTEEMRKLLSRMGGTLERYASSEEKGMLGLWERNRERARALLREALVIAEIARAEGIPVDPEEDSEADDAEERRENKRWEVLRRRVEERLLAIALGEFPEPQEQEPAADGASGEVAGAPSVETAAEAVPAGPAPEA